MYKLYYTQTNRSYRQLKAFLVNRNIPFVKRKISEADPITLEELYDILGKTENGLEDIVAKKSKPYRERIACSHVKESEFYETKLSNALKFIQENPTAIKSPILTTNKIAFIGYSDEEISVLLPREVKKQIFQQTLKSAI